MRAALGRLGFAAEGQAAVANADNGGQGLNNIADVQMMTDFDVESMCTSIRRPGGTIDDGHGNQVPNRGTEYLRHPREEVEVDGLLYQAQEALLRQLHARHDH